jgi:hypothetical protein
MGNTSTTIFFSGPINVITAIRLGDGWHEDIAEFSFYGDGQSELITQAGATWLEKGCRFSCPLHAILALRQGYLPAPDEMNRKLQRAIAWLSDALQDGEAHPTKALRRDAKESANFSSEILDRAREALPIKCFKHGPMWYWRMIPQGDDVPEPGTRSALITLDED